MTDDQFAHDTFVYRLKQVISWGWRQWNFHSIAYVLDKTICPSAIRMFVFTVGEGFEDAYRRFGGGRCTYHEIFRMYGRDRYVAYRIGWFLGRGNDHRYRWGGYAWVPWHRRDGRDQPDMEGVAHEGLKILSGGK